ncbi:hypothetical protein B0H14DRAFT_3471751 [Mycena olivaceomarginata]|nr:hypothetical protein B0H14DRAFT_3471751 [Mycena olivaceomarginata]
MLLKLSELDVLNTIMVQHGPTTPNSEKLSLNNSVGTNRLTCQIMTYIDEKVKQGALFFLDFHDLKGNLAWEDESTFLWGLCIHSTPLHFYLHLMPLSGACVMNHPDSASQISFFGFYHIPFWE